MFTKPRTAAFIVAVTAWIAAILTTAPAIGESNVPELPVRNFTNQTAHKVLDVPDGHTVVVSINDRATTVRLIGVDAPESSQPTGTQARCFLQNLLIGESVYIEKDPVSTAHAASDAPILACLYRAPDGLFVNLELIRQGYARQVTGATYPQMELFRFWEQAAQTARKGIWNPAPSAPSAQAETSPPSTQPATGPADPARRTPAAAKPAHTPLPAQPPAGETTVYVTRTGTKYHLAGCSSLRTGSTPLSLKAAKDKGLTPCARCKPPQ
jgi:micrococcal nuclease